MEAEAVIRDATIFDGSGSAPFRGTVAVARGRIVAVARGDEGQQLRAAVEIDGGGQALAPGFIDIHSHSDWILPQEDHPRVLAPLLEQGVTTIVTGNCGFSPCPVEPASAHLLETSSELVRDRPIDLRWRTHKEFLDDLASRELAINVAHLAGHGSIRLAVMGMRFEAASEEDLRQMEAWVREALEAGCVGLSTGLGYAPGMFATAAELARLASVVAEYGRLFTSHLRAYSWVSPFFSLSPRRWKAHNLRAIDEILGIARKSRARTQISHLIYVGSRTWRTAPQALQAIERARADGIDVAFDTFPYTGGNTTIRVIYPAWAQVGLPRNLESPVVRARLRAEWSLMRHAIDLEPSDIQLLWAADPELADLEGLTFDEIGRRLGMAPLRAYQHVTLRSGARARVLLRKYSGDDGDEEAMRVTMAHPLNTVETDTILTTRGHHNPASFGTFPRFLGRYCRELGLLSLSEGIRRMTSDPADRVGLRRRGRIAEGCWADLVLFDPQRIGSDADFSRPDLPPQGIEGVFVNGRPVVERGRYDPQRLAGRLLRAES